MSNQNLNDLKYKEIENKVEPSKNPEFNPSTVLSYNAAGHLIKIQQTINGTTYTQLVTYSDDSDTTVATTKTFNIIT